MGPASHKGRQKAITVAENTDHPELLRRFLKSTGLGSGLQVILINVFQVRVQAAGDTGSVVEIALADAGEVVVHG